MFEAAQIRFGDLGILGQQHHLHGPPVGRERHCRPQDTAETSAQIATFVGNAHRATRDDATPQRSQQWFQMFHRERFVQEPSRIVGRMGVNQVGSLQP